MTDWQPIATAPRDDTACWAYEAGKQFIARWQRKNKRLGHERGFLRRFDQYWEPCDPTHWQPLPSPPADARGGGR